MDEARKVGGSAGNRGKGRKKGVPNKVTQIAKDAIAEAFERIGGTDRLVAWIQADEANERLFMGTIYPKLLPLQVNAELDARLKVSGALAWLPQQ